MTKRYFLEPHPSSGDFKAVVYDGATFINLTGSFEDKVLAEERLAGYRLGDDHDAEAANLTPTEKLGYDLAIAD